MNNRMIVEKKYDRIISWNPPQTATAGLDTETEAETLAAGSLAVMCAVLAIIPICNARNRTHFKQHTNCKPKLFSHNLVVHVQWE